ncbi:PH domain-containing protein [Spirillospora sp. NPDC049652]|jgi:uncharacterized membrane protein YdbT with pleckstrin-like domain
MNMQDMMVFRDAGSRTVDRYLMNYEGHVIAVRQHPAVLLLPVAAAFLALVLCTAVNALTGFAWIWLLWIVSLGYLLWKVFAWSIQFFLVTEHRIMMITGVLNRQVAMMPLAKVTDIRFDRSVLGRTLGYGEFLIESAGQNQGFDHVTFMPYPEQLYLEVSSLVFGSRDAAPD